MKHFVILSALTATLLSVVALGQDQAPPLQAEAVSLAGHLDKQHAELTISATLLDQAQREDRLLYTTRLRDEVEIAPDAIQQRTEFDFKRVQGKFTRIVIGLSGPDIPDSVTSPYLHHWSLRNHPDNKQELVLDFKGEAKELDRLTVTATFSRSLESFPSELDVNAWDMVYPSLATGTLNLHPAPSLSLQAKSLTGLIPLNDGETESRIKRYRFHGTTYRAQFSVVPTDPDSQRIILSNLQLKGRLAEGALTFTLSGTASTKNPRTAQLRILDGGAALTDFNLVCKTGTVIVDK